MTTIDKVERCRYMFSNIVNLANLDDLHALLANINA